MSKTITVEIRKAVDAYHKIGSIAEVPDDKYHKALLKLGFLKRVEVEEAEPANEPLPEIPAQPGLEQEELPLEVVD